MNINEFYRELEADRVESENSSTFQAELAFLRFTELMLERMEELEITRSQLAEKIGVKPAYITKILRGDTNFTLETMVKLAHALDCDLSCMLVPKKKAPSSRPAKTKAKAKSPAIRRPKGAPALAVS